MGTETNLHLVHDGIGAQDVVLLLRVGLCMLYGPSCLSTGRQANHHQDLKQVHKKNVYSASRCKDYVITVKIKPLLNKIVTQNMLCHMVAPAVPFASYIYYV